METNSVLLPKTDFPQKADAHIKEPLFIKFWEENSIVEKRNAINKTPFSLHDGMVYTSGTVHIGHIFNKTLKDIINRYKLMRGYKVDFVPFFDCHGLPTELQAVKGNKELPPHKIREICLKFSDEYANKQIDIFKRFGIMGDWLHIQKTTDHTYETKQLELFYNIFNSGAIYKGKKPTIYSPSTKTVLAEAELEYFDVESQGLYVKFKTTENRYLIAYTTTEWTLKQNQALCLNSNIKYVKFYFGEDDDFCIASESYAKNLGVDYTESFLPKEYYNIDGKVCPIVYDNYVEDSETGIVHICGGHGKDDYRVCQQNGIEPLNVTDEKQLQNFIDTYRVDGKHIFATKTITHSYPHDWRTKKPVYYCMTDQFFINIQTYKTELLSSVETVDWGKDKFKNKMISTINERNDWCISRQRVWGFPIPLFYDLVNEKYVLDQTMFEHLKDLFNTHGSNIWFEKGVDFLLPPNYDIEGYNKVTDTLDVWFDSGSSWNMLYDGDAQADLYLEGIDQYRGWFQSSLILSVLARGVAPYKKVITHNFVMDETGNKMSKSLGNVVDPMTILSKYNVDIIRLWVISNDYENNIAVSDNILKQCFNTYFRIRNTLRFMQSNLYDWDYNYNVHTFPLLNGEDIEAIDSYNRFLETIIPLYDEYNFRAIYQLLADYFTKLSSNYFTTQSKIDLYEKKGDDRKRKQYVFQFLSIRLVKLLAPIVPFLAEEFYSHLVFPGKKESIFLEEL